MALLVEEVKIPNVTPECVRKISVEILPNRSDSGQPTAYLYSTQLQRYVNCYEVDETVSDLLINSHELDIERIAAEAEENKRIHEIIDDIKSSTQRNIPISNLLLRLSQDPNTRNNRVSLKQLFDLLLDLLSVSADK